LNRNALQKSLSIISYLLILERPALQVNIQIMRAFTQLRKMLATHENLKRKIEAMERKCDEQFQIVFPFPTSALQIPNSNYRPPIQRFIFCAFEPLNPACRAVARQSEGVNPPLIFIYLIIESTNQPIN
jgi:hypothetical protein